ncbi:glycerophosphodiester phosphodiesterase [Sanguibacter suaedae]|uniref:Glycerophosphodiester phosphodiesterase n=1 Tax=Sanguibacter suaedae TaxID=2795737 RepID=A0A934I785_9MICO|nr:glycerophosphodiester phosphodiesterase [Sanguibacter suaedae]MBI9115516.1 glycerophosphodiester phosphodiesterase [Sanguibacter suaedae]
MTDSHVRPARPLAVSHRGDHPTHRENTLLALDAAMTAGADAIEVDVQLTADGVPVLVHDDTFERLWGDPRPVAATTWDQVRTLGEGEVRVPRLAEALDLSVERGVPLVLDQKHATTSMAALRTVQETGATETAFCGSLEGLVAVRTASAGTTLFLNDTNLQLPDVRTLALVRPQYYNPYWRFLAPATVDAMHTFGIRVCCWTPSDPEDLALVLDMGVDAVMTDRLDTLVAQLDARTS